MKANSGGSTPLVKFGPFTLTLTCNNAGGGNVQAEIDATSTEDDCDGYSTQMTTAGVSYKVLQTSAAGKTFSENDDNAADFFTPSGKTYIVDLTVGQNYLGATCFANALVSPS